ncbi:pantoate--beta-alanine ligase [Desulfofalx alkaliphila]|uniref:pantoate--beta-alanine ligase n=1 Tax=Desulfofalx alkaliphila TaxID=105483 RepID=UPI0004E24268|nr:pantoate--beta-alanine ligase [Desulfofalx alkaliphila]
MILLKTCVEVQNYITEQKKQNKTIGLVPTMGYFHQGHLSLMEKAVRQCDKVVTSIYVNPLQFGPREDLASYPRDLERDLGLAKGAGVDVIFAPTDSEMYPQGFNTTVSVGEELTDKLCGSKRPGHFTGVSTVVTKLLNIVKPHKAYFGQKDAQQLLVIKRVVADLNMDTEIVAVPTVREQDGLAMSSRNTYLTPEQRAAATVLYQSLQMAKGAVKEGRRRVPEICQMVADQIKKEPLAKLDYVELYSYPHLKSIDEITGPALLAVAAFFGKARLIDNIILEA